ncbi:MAG: YceI family protein [Verrucomicrobiota bacterium]
MLPNPNDCHFRTANAVETFEGVVVDVRTPEAYAEAHIPGTDNHCVYQVDFLESFPEAYPDKKTEILVYGDGEPYKADLAALGRLQALGYTDVSILKGGLTQWLAESRTVEGEEKTAGETIGALSLVLEAKRTKVRWVGRNLLNQHYGEIIAKDGFLELNANGQPTAGKVTVDLRKIINHDIEDKSLAKGLISHLASADFFDVENHPDAFYELSSAKPLAASTYGKPNYRVSGLMTARGKTMALDIEALIEPIESGYVFQATFDFDRTQVGALYGSGRIFERLGMHLVNDLVSVDVAAFFTAS